MPSEARQGGRRSVCQHLHSVHQTLQVAAEESCRGDPQGTNIFIFKS